MYSGKDLWGSRISFELVARTLADGRVIETFPDLPEHIYGALVDSARNYPDKYALVDDLGRRFTYAGLLEKTDQFAACLKRRFGVRKGDHVALLAFSTSEYVVALLALVKLGAVVVILPTKFKEQEIRSLAAQADLDCVICDRKYASWFETDCWDGRTVISYQPDSESFAFDAFTAETPVFPENAEGGYEDVSVMMFTSGTTSLSKGVLLTNYNFMHAAAVYRIIFHVTAEDSTVVCVPIYTITGLSAVLGTFLCAGGTIYLQRRFRASQVLRCIRDYKLTYLHAAPTVCNFLLDEKENFPALPSLRYIVCGGSRMKKEKIIKLHDWLPDCEFHNVYGMTETTSPGTIFPGNPVNSKDIESTGIPVPGLIYKVVDEDKKELLPGQVGEIMVSGACIMAGYYKINMPLYQNGWLDTGDVGDFTEEGGCYILDRKKDMINRGGEKLTSSEVEDQLYQMDGIEDAVVVGIPDEKYGEVPAALIRLEKGAKWSEAGIQAYLREQIAKYKIPVRIRFADEIPLTPNGKIDKKRIRSIFFQTGI